MSSKASGTPSIHVTLLTQAQCGFCEQAHEVVRRLASEYHLAITMIDTQTPEGQSLVQRGGVLFPPGIFLDGQAFSYGRLSERKLRRELERRQGARNGRTRT